MEKLTIVGWTDFDSSYPTKDLTRENSEEIIYLLRKEIAENNYLFSGEEHQNHYAGAPVFSDGTCFRASMRFWGYLMASTWNILLQDEEDFEEFTYMDFYMPASESETQLPESSDIDAEPSDIVPVTCGALMNEDIQMLSQAQAMGMPFITTDKVLMEISDRMKDIVLDDED